MAEVPVDSQATCQIWEPSSVILTSRGNQHAISLQSACTRRLSHLPVREHQTIGTPVEPLGARPRGLGTGAVVGAEGVGMSAVVGTEGFGMGAVMGCCCCCC